MTNRRENLVARIRSVPDELIAEVEQSVERIILSYGGVYRLSGDERAAIQEGIAAAERGDFMSDEEVQNLLTRHRE